MTQCVPQGDEGCAERHRVRAKFGVSFLPVVDNTLHISPFTDVLFDKVQGGLGAVVCGPLDIAAF